MYMPKVTNNNYKTRQIYHEIFCDIYCIMFWNDNGWTENISTPMDHICRCTGEILLHGICYQGNNQPLLTQTMYKEVFHLR